MFEAYKIGITVALTGQVSSMLGMWSRQFALTNTQALALKRTFNDIKLLGTSGLILGGLGYAGFRVIGDMVKPATEYAHQLNIMNMAGLKQQEIAEAIGSAWKNTSTVITTTATDNLKMLLDMRNVLGSMGDAQMALPIVSKIQAVLASSSEGGIRKAASDNFAFSMAKALDIVGAASDPKRFEREAGEMAKVVTAFQGRVTPQQFQSVFAYARQAKFGLGEEFRYQILPTLMLEYSQGANSQGGGSRGVGPALAAFARLTLQGYINKKAMPELEALGLVKSSTSLRTTTKGTTVGPMTRADLAAANPFQWVQQVLMPAINQRLGPNASREQVMQEIIQITRGNQLASQLILEFAMKQQNFLRDQGIIRGAMPYQQAYQQAMFNDPNFAYAALHSQWENLKTALGTSVIPILVPALMKLTLGLNDLSQWARANPTGVKIVVDAFLVLSASLAFSGVVMTLAAAFKALRLVMIAGAATNLGGVGSSLGTIAAATGAVTVLGAVAASLAVIGTGVAGEKVENWTARKLGMKEPSGYTWDYMVGGLPVPIPHWDQPGAPGGTNHTTGAGGDDKSLGDRIGSYVKSALEGARIELDGTKVGKLLFGSGPPTDAGSQFDSRASAPSPTGQW